MSIVPVIAKADTLTIEERQEFKERVMNTNSLITKACPFIISVFISADDVGIMITASLSFLVLFVLPALTCSILKKPCMFDLCVNLDPLTDKARLSNQWDLRLPPERV